MSKKRDKSEWDWVIFAFIQCFLCKFDNFSIYTSKATYFTIKKQKLEAQFRLEAEENYPDLDAESRQLFKNVAIFVNGYTNPTSIELKSIMKKYGGVYYEYYNDSVTHIIASNLAFSKANILKSKLVVRPEWITQWLAINYQFL